MKRQITFLSLLFLVTTAFLSCKKDTESTKARIMGKWSVNKIVITGNTSDAANGTFTYGKTTDYMDFKSNEDDQVELGLSGQRTIGTYEGTIDSFNMAFPEEGSSYCTINTLTENVLQFTAKVDKTNIVKVYYLSR
ncbi:hypothetical protein DHW03_15835 [Pedobacter yonginense]|uniref:Lipocalin-like domain-containing protein n=1 Tax=Pedobacter yonginense TaxID=651869 RepID=A0A317EHH4_9SPHI|nr:hypothetical protein [Pedobacter yonginense]PWS26260.1 hypothetical protein DHW03_15835 [Pedobacter yonginense]